MVISRVRSHVIDGKWKGLLNHHVPVVNDGRGLTTSPRATSRERLCRVGPSRRVDDRLRAAPAADPALSNFRASPFGAPQRLLRSRMMCSVAGMPIQPTRDRGRELLPRVFTPSFSRRLTLLPMWGGGRGARWSERASSSRRVRAATRAIVIPISNLATGTVPLPYGSLLLIVVSQRGVGSVNRGQQSWPQSRRHLAREQEKRRATRLRGRDSVCCRRCKDDPGAPRGAWLSR